MTSFHGTRGAFSLFAALGATFLVGACGGGSAQVGHHDRRGRGDGVNAWNSEHASRECSQDDLVATGGAGLFYCFGID